MKRVFTSAGALAIGVLGISTADAEEPKIWNLRAKLRGFYDSNWATLNSQQAGHDDSFGIEVNPVGSFTQETGPSTWSAEYDYRMRFYEGRNDNRTDNQHKVTLQLENSFHDNWTLTVSDRFAIAQEPGVFEGVITAPTRQSRAEASYNRNIFNIGVRGLINETVGVNLSYNNRIDDNQLDNDDINSLGSRSALLDAVRHTFDPRVFWNYSDVTELSLGLQVMLLRYTSEDLIATGVSPFNRDGNHYRPYVGVQHKFTDVMQGLVNVGFEYAEYPNALPGSPEDSVNPWVSGKFAYNFSEEGRMQVGVRHQRNATDVAVGSGNLTNPTQNVETTTVFGSVDSRLSGPLSASLVFQMQNSTFEGGGADGQRDQLYVGGLTFKYDIMEGMVAETGYLVDRLDSDLTGRSFVRHRGFLGLSYSY